VKARATELETCAEINDEIDRRGQRGGTEVVAGEMDEVEE